MFNNVSCRKVWDALTGDELHSFEHKHIVRACAFSEVKLAFVFPVQLSFDKRMVLFKFCSANLHA